MGHFRIGEFTVLAALGSGAASRVLHIRRQADSRAYALKVVPLDGGVNRKYLEQVRREYRVGRMFDHPGLAKVHALEIEKDWLFWPKQAKLLVEYAPGRPMNLVTLPGVAELLRVFEQIANALAHMHTRGVCHGDLKPGNLVLGPGQRVKVIDYGLSWVEGEPLNRLRGTPEYMAPETAERKVINRRTDIFNLGATMYRLVTHRFLPVPTPGLPLGEKTYRRSLVPVAALRPTLPAQLCELIHRCIDYQPDRRPRSAAEVGTLLRQVFDTGRSNGEQEPG